MQENYSALGEKAFGDAADALINVKYRSHLDALKAVESSLRDSGGISLLFGPDGSGKTTILRSFALHLASELDVVFVDGTRLKAQELLRKMLQQLGNDPGDNPVDQMLREAREIVVEQAHSWRSPVLIVDNVDRMYPSSLQVLNNLASAEADKKYALRFILSGHALMQNLVGSEGMTNVAQREPGGYTLEPLSAKETMIYLHARLQAAGSERADTVFPFDVCDRLREQSGGWPGSLNRFALEAIKRADGFPLSVVDTVGPGERTRQATATDLPVLNQDNNQARKPPQLVVSKNGRAVAKYVFKEKKVLLGRSDFADIVIDDDFVSKVHAVFLLYSDALILLDLNSSNGTTVNSVVTRKTILRSNDIISLGDHRIKIEHAPAVSADMERLMKSPDTLKMKNLIDLRRQRAKRRVKSAR